MKPILLASTLLPIFASAATLTIDNAGLSASYDDAAGTFAATDKATGQLFLKEGRLEGGGAKASIEAAADAIFGPGKRIVVAQADGSSVSLELYEALPFLLVRQERKNGGTADLDLQKAVPATFGVDLGLPADKLKTMGTGGLLAPDKNPGSYLCLAVADPATRNGVVAGWISQFKGSGTVFSEVKDGQVALKAQLEHGHLILKPGQSAKLDTLAIGRFADARLGLEQFADAVAKFHAIKLRPKTAVYCSWYAEGKDHGGAGTPATTRELAKFIADHRLQEYGLGVIQLDDWWQDGPKIGGPATCFDRVGPTGPYKEGIAPVAKDVEAQGLVFGLWWLPFGRNHMQPEFADKQDWFFKWANGKPLRQKSFGGTCLDSSNPAVQQHLETLARTIRSWGVKYYKMDGLNAGCGVDHCYINDGYKNDGFGNSLPPHDPSLTQIEVMRRGLATIRKGAGDDVFFSGCCAVQNLRTYAGTIGLVDSMRVGPDFNHDGEGIRSGPLRGSRMYFLNGKVWWNDPDPSKVRTSTEGCVADGSINGGVSTAQAQMTSSWVSLSNQFFLVSDWLPNLPEERLDILKKTMAPHGATARPVDYFDNALANTWLVTDTKTGVRRDVLGLFNFYGNPTTIHHTAAWLGLDPDKTYAVFDFWADRLRPPFRGEFSTLLGPQSCRVLAVRPVEDHPLVLSTSRHVSQGILDLAGEKWQKPTATLAGISRVIGGDPYELRILVASSKGNWNALKAEVSEEDAGAGVEISMKPEAGILRVTIKSPKSREVMWSVDFDKKPVPNPAATPIVNLKVEQFAAGDYPIISWTGGSPFNEVKCDGQLIGTAAESLIDASAPGAKAPDRTYAVTPIGWDGQRGETATVVFHPKTFTPRPVPPSPKTRLTALQPLRSTTGWGSLQIGKEVGGLPLKLSGQTYADGIGLHANGEVAYAIPAGAKRFVAIAGLDDSQRTDPRASIVCQVLAKDANGKEILLGQTPVLKTGETMQWNLDLPIPAGTVELRLLVNDADDGIACDHADWVDAGFRND